MIKLIVAIKRKQGMSVEAFQKHWHDGHASIVRASPATMKYIRRYIQCHTMAQQYEHGEPAFDGTAELWFDSVSNMDAFYKDPDYLATMKPDEPRFADMEQTKFFVTLEHPIL